MVVLRGGVAAPAAHQVGYWGLHFHYANWNCCMQHGPYQYHHGFIVPPCCLDGILRCGVYGTFAMAYYNM
jgi:hypothetical protein